MGLANEWHRALDCVDIIYVQIYPSSVPRMDEKLPLRCVLRQPCRVIDLIEVEREQQS
jgi:hypothetical protein